MPPPPTRALTDDPHARICGDRPLRVQGDEPAVAGAVVRLVGSGWELDVEPVRESDDLWALWRSCASCPRGC